MLDGGSEVILLWCLKKKFIEIKHTFTTAVEPLKCEAIPGERGGGGGGGVLPYEMLFILLLLVFSLLYHKQLV